MALRQITQEDVDNRSLSHSHSGYASAYDVEERENFRAPITENSLSGLSPWEEILQSDSPNASYYDEEERENFRAPRTENSLSALSPWEEILQSDSPIASYYDDETAPHYDEHYDDETDNSVSVLSSPSELLTLPEQYFLSHLRNASLDQLLSMAVDLAGYLDLRDADRAANEKDGLTEEIISQCVKSRHCQKADIMEICVVCQSEYEKGEMLATLACGHEYHGSCIRRWLMEKDFCPVCKRKANGHHHHGSC